MKKEQIDQIDFYDGVYYFYCLPLFEDELNCTRCWKFVKDFYIFIKKSVDEKWKIDYSRVFCSECMHEELRFYQEVKVKPPFQIMIEKNDLIESILKNLD